MLKDKRILCLGNNTEDTDNRATQLAELNDSVNFGLVSKENLTEQRVPGVYHTTIVDCSYQDIQSIIKDIDLLYVFDQTHDDNAVKHRTLEIAEMLSADVEVQYENTDITSNYNYWSQLVKDNKSFCIYPFIELMAQNGKTSLCCRSSVHVEDVENIVDWQTNEKYQHIRNKMIKGEKIPHCNACYNIEKLGVTSSRQLDTTMWAERLNLTSVEQLATIKTPAYYEVRASNVCNLQCRMCGPQWSNQLEKEFKEIGITSKDTTYGYTGFDMVKLDQLEKLYVAGGEPTVQVEFIEFLKDCITKGKTDFELHINTNATKINDRFREIIKQFPKASFTVSIDGYEDLNYYIRYPSKWNDIVDNIQWLDDNNYKISFNTVASVLNIGRLDELFSFLDGTFPGNQLDCTYSSGVMTPFAFPLNEQALADLNAITQKDYYKNNKLFTNNIDGLIKYFTNRKDVDNKTIENFFDLNDKLDQSRDMKLEDYRPEIAVWRKSLTTQTS